MRFLLFFSVWLGLISVAHAQYYPWGDQHWQAPVASESALPVTGNFAGDVRLDLTGFNQWIWTGSAWQEAGTGTVTSVGLSDVSNDPIYEILNSPITSSGTLHMELLTQNANQIFAGPASGSAAQPSFRAAVSADISSLFGTFSDSSSGADGITVTNGGTSVLGSGTSIAQQVATSSENGYLDSTDWSTFNGKQAAGNYATSGSGDVSWSAHTGGGAVTTSLVATSNSSLATLSGLTTASSLATIGTITSGTWQGTDVGAHYGGTGINSSSSTGTAQVSSGTWSVGTLALGNTSYVSGQLGTANGGTGLNAPTAHYMLVAEGSSAFNTVAPNSTSGIPWISNGSTSDPGYGTVVVGGGGTGITSGTSGGILYFSGSGTMASSTALTQYGVVMGGGTGGAPTSSTAGTAGQIFTSNGSSAGTYQTGLAGSGLISRNFLINAALPWWQRGTSTTISNGAGSYQADRFYAWNSLGAAGVLTYAQHAASLNQSVFAADVHVSTGPTTSENYGINWGQSLDNITSMQLYGQTVSTSVEIKAQNNVNQVTVALGYATSEAKFGISSGLPTTIISSATCSVSTSSFTLCSLNNVSMSTSVTTSGSYFWVVYVSGISSGHVSDSTNGFYAEQPMLNLGAVAAPFLPAGANASDELLMCQRYYEKTFDPTTAPAQDSGTNAGALYSNGQVANQAFSACWNYKATKRTAGTVTTYSPNASTSNWEGTGTPASTVEDQGTQGVCIQGSGTITAGDSYQIHASVDSDI